MAASISSGTCPSYQSRGPVPPGSASRAAAGHPATRWALIITDPHGHAVGYGHAPRAKPIPGHPADGWTITLKTQRIATGCDPP